MTDTPSFDIDFAVGATPSAADPSVSLDILLTTVVTLPSLRLEVDAVSAGVALELRRDDSGFKLVPTFHGPDGPAGAAASVELPGVTGGGQLLKAGDEWRGAMALQFSTFKVTGLRQLKPMKGREVCNYQSAQLPSRGSGGAGSCPSGYAY